MRRVDELADLILYHKKKYYDGEPEISDTAYDKLEDELRELDHNHPVLLVVGSPAGGKVQHDPTMLSAQKATDPQTVEKWLRDNNHGPVVMGYKIDGLSLSLVYENGILIQAATRGNGQQGDDVSLQALKIHDIPYQLPNGISANVRGEVYMKKSEFDRVNETLETKYSSPRNLATGTLKQKDLRILDDRALHFSAWQLIGYDDDASISTQWKDLEDWGFVSADFLLIEKPTIVTVEEYFEQEKIKRDQIDFELDGIIFKYNEADAREDAGYTEHHPKWSIAWKFPSQGEITTIKDIDWQVGRTGVLTPVARVEPIEVAGAVIQNATIHNAEFLENLGAAPGDEVLIVRSGDVIPKIEEVVVHNNQPFEFPKTCPSCGTQVTREGVNLICNSPKCRDRDLQSILYWLRVTEIKGLGPKSIELLYDVDKIDSAADLYALTAIELEEHLGKNGVKAYEALQDNKTIPLAIFLAGLGINNLGKKMGKVLAKEFGSLEKVQQATQSDLVQLEGISDLTASYIIEGLKANELINQLLQNGIIISEKKKQVKGRVVDPLSFFDDLPQVEYKEEVERDPIEFKGSIYVTGKIPDKNKKQIQDFVEGHGYEWQTSISSTLDLLVYGEKAGQAKLDKAIKSGVKVLSWEEFVTTL